MSGVNYCGLVSSDPDQPNAVDSIVWRYEDTGERDRATFDELRRLADESREEADDESLDWHERLDSFLMARGLRHLIAEGERELLSRTPSARLQAQLDREWAACNFNTKGHTTDDDRY